MGDPLSAWWTEPVKIERLAGTGAYGDTFDAPATVYGAVDARTKLVVDMSGNTVTSSATVALPWSVDDVPARSRVTLPDGRVTRVVSTARGRTQLGTPDHLELSLL